MWFQWTLTTEAGKMAGMIKTDTQSEAADLLELRFGNEGTLIIQPYDMPGS